MSLDEPGNVDRKLKTIHKEERNIPYNIFNNGDFESGATKNQCWSEGAMYRVRLK